MKEIALSKTHESRATFDQNRENGTIQTQWNFAGPFNVGGRTRAAAFDILDLSGNTIVAGGVSGGVWKSLNGGSTWSRKSDPELRNSVTTIVQDTRIGKGHIWYYGTGELLGNSARSGSQTPYRGDGIFKSLDNGETWTQIISTKDSDPSRFGSQFQYIWRILTDHTDTDNDVLLVAAYGGILRSEDGGDSWQVVLGETLNNLSEDVNLNEVQAPFYTDLAKSQDGNFYAYLSDFTSVDSDYPEAGIYWSEDGIEWFHISEGLTNETLNRTVLDANNSTAFAFATSGDLEFLYRYDLNGVDGSGAPIGAWTDLSNNLPTFSGIGALNTQNGYNMTVRIHPSNPDLVLLGGTNLYRSIEGFSAKTGMSWIGGYKEDTNGIVYENHHPDQHEIFFHPSNDKIVFNANDGGIYKTDDIFAREVNWTSLNNGYATSQFYTVHIPKSEDEDIIIGGMQDNGTYATLSSSPLESWTQVLGGDGSYCSTVPFGLFWYFSAQDGQIYRFTYTDDDVLFARVDPLPGPQATQSEYIFINPFVLDPLNYNIMYLAGGNAIWKNTNLAQIPNGSTQRTDVNWLMLNQSRLDSGLITSVEISHNSEYLFYGTSTGELYRLSNLGEQPEFEFLEDFGNLHYVSSIAANPGNDSEIVVILSNYGIKSIFHSVNAGATFTDISGNLEEFPDGTGNGPSIRSAEIVPIADGSTRYFAGTSVGLYSTDLLDGINTQWLKEGESTVGKSVIRAMDYRPTDGTMVLGTHGNGIFRAQITGNQSIEPTTVNAPNRFIASKSFPNPFSDQTKIEFEIPETQYLRVDIYDMMGNHVKNLFIGPQFAGKSSVTWDGKNQHNEFVEDGMYLFRIYYDGLIQGGRVVFNR